jgi:hypothetical protein
LSSVTRLRLAHFCDADPRLRKPGICPTSADRAALDGRAPVVLIVQQRNLHRVVAAFKAQIEAFVGI